MLLELLGSESPSFAFVLCRRGLTAIFLFLRGINALDAVNLSYSSISALRQQIKPAERVHGIITDGGLAPNGEVFSRCHVDVSIKLISRLLLLFQSSLIILP